MVWSAEDTAAQVLEALKIVLEPKEVVDVQVRFLPQPVPFVSQCFHSAFTVLSLCLRDCCT